MTFEEWYDKQGDVEIDYSLLRAAWNGALEEAAKLLEQEDVGGDPDDLYTGRRHRAAKIRALKEKP